MNLSIVFVDGWAVASVRLPPGAEGMFIQYAESNWAPTAAVKSACRRASLEPELNRSRSELK